MTMESICHDLMILTKVGLGVLVALEVGLLS